MRLAQLKKSNNKGGANLVGMVDERLFPVRFLDIKVGSSALDLCGINGKQPHQRIEFGC